MPVMLCLRLSNTFAVKIPPQDNVNGIQIRTFADTFSFLIDPALSLDFNRLFAFVSKDFLLLHSIAQFINRNHRPPN